MARGRGRLRGRVQELYLSTLRGYRHAQAVLSGAHSSRSYTWIPQEAAEVQCLGRMLSDLADALRIQPPAVTLEEATESYDSVQKLLRGQSDLLRNSDFLRYSTPEGKRQVSGSIVELSSRLSDLRKDLETSEIIQELECRNWRWTDDPHIDR